MIMKKYFFVAFNAINKGYVIGCGCYVIVCSYCFVWMYEAILNRYNKNAPQKADGITITSLTVLDKQTAAQLSENFTDGALIIDDGNNTEEKKIPCIDRWVARDEDGTLCVYFSKNPPKKEETVWGADYDTYVEIDGSLFPEVKWSDEEPTKVKLVIDK